MILPYLYGIVHFRQAPMTWFLFFLNCVFFILTLQNQLFTQKRLKPFYEQKELLVFQGQFYSQYVLQNSDRYSPLMLELSRGTQAGSEKKAKHMGQLAFRDPLFLKTSEALEFEGDQVAVEYWKQQVREIASIRDSSTMIQNGLSYDHAKFWNLFSYQFLHGDIMHLLSNMFFLLIFGIAVEKMLGTWAVLAVYLSTGVAAALVFSAFSGLSALPLVGSSGSISGLMGFFGALYRTRPVKFFFWFFPAKDFVGFMYLPAWIAFAMWILLDMTGVLSTIPELGGTAHMAHLGGVFAGLLMGITVSFFWKVPLVDDRE
ncbi:MAG: rhomboid family intramembrane serine protease [Bdellovibrionales bacterium]